MRWLNARTVAGFMLVTFVVPVVGLPLLFRASSRPVTITVIASPGLPSDPFQSCAIRALRGEWGKLPRWKRDAYIWGLAKNVTCAGRSKVTAYGHLWEPGGTVTASGQWVSTDFCAAPRSLAFGMVIWTPWGLRYVMDRGGKVTLAYTNNRENMNLDYYTVRGRGTSRSQPWAVVKRKTNWTKRLKEGR